jgi:hypothetical protein
MDDSTYLQQTKDKYNQVKQGTHHNWNSISIVNYYVFDDMPVRDWKLTTSDLNID